MFNVVNGNITLTRGDTGRIQCKYTNALNNEIYEMDPEDKLIFTVRNNTNDIVKLQKVVYGSDTIRLFSDDTSDMTLGKYFYDVQLQTVDGEVSTIGPFMFIVLKGFVYHSI